MTQTSDQATTRTQLVDAQLAHAGWSKSRRSLIEAFVLAAQAAEWAYAGQQFADYVLLRISDQRDRPFRERDRRIRERDRPFR